MEFNVIERDGKRFLEGEAGQPFLRDESGAILLVEACANEGASGLLLYTENLTARFFDLSSREAGEILQKLRNYGLRLAVVRSPADAPLSRRFSELMLEENRDRFFHLYEDRDEAEAWLFEA